VTFNRIDDISESGNARVRYVLMHIDYLFEIQATRTGIRLTGTTPYYSDWAPVQKYLNFAQYQSQKLKETGSSVSEQTLEERIM
jgi:hypothetical protein